jgi:cystathionine beta-lyase/cystathionine gamma-synthase
MKLNTIAIHGLHPEQHKIPGSPITFPIYQTSTFHLGDHEYEQILNSNARAINMYSRLGNPTLRNAAERYAALHGAERGEAFASGLGAIVATLLTFLSAGDSIVTSLDVYGGTVVLLNSELVRLGIEVINVEPNNLDEIRRAIKPSTKILYFETIANPLLKIPNIPEIVKLGKEKNLHVIIDNTFASPCNFRPLDHGADLVLESSTKYLGGHSDCVGGFVAGRDELMQKVWHTAVYFGANADPFAAFLVERGMKTLPLRVERHNANALRVAQFLEQHPAVTKVYYPGLATHPDHVQAKNFLKGFGGMVSFIVKGGNEAGLRVLKQLRFPAVATSLGGVESLVEMPFNTSHAVLSAEQQAKVGIVPGFIRLSIGIEDADDLIADLTQALEKV